MSSRKVLLNAGHKDRITERLSLLLSAHIARLTEIDRQRCRTRKEIIIVKCHIVGNHDATPQLDDDSSLYPTMATEVITGRHNNKQRYMTLSTPCCRRAILLDQIVSSDKISTQNSRTYILTRRYYSDLFPILALTDSTIHPDHLYVNK